MLAGDDTLSSRERDVLRPVAEGFSNQEITVLLCSPDHRVDVQPGDRGAAVQPGRSTSRP
ncbi:LuxR C-terminal-related transcriptional regulator [Nonomuraea fuscirosea]|uniref:LuxR C-terminal-related transcriptional regulator n=1 Tax=Nonomuraea fuscirosea TaxID=1291556 RepID=UPI003444B117